MFQQQDHVLKYAFEGTYPKQLKFVQTTWHHKAFCTLPYGSTSTSISHSLSSISAVKYLVLCQTRTHFFPFSSPSCFFKTSVAACIDGWKRASASYWGEWGPKLSCSSQRMIVCKRGKAASKRIPSYVRHNINVRYKDRDRTLTALGPYMYLNRIDRIDIRDRSGIAVTTTSDRCQWKIFTVLVVKHSHFIVPFV